jgi:hypothetical protein
MHYAESEPLLLVECLSIALFHFFSHFLLGLASCQKCLYFCQSFEQPVLEDHSRTRIHKSQQCLSSVVMLIVFLVVPSGLFGGGYFELNFDLIGSLGVVSLSAFVLHGVVSHPFDLSC